MKRTSKARLQCELLESRLQPGSLLTGGLGASALGTGSFDQSSGSLASDLNATDDLFSNYHHLRLYDLIVADGANISHRGPSTATPVAAPSQASTTQTPAPVWNQLAQQTAASRLSVTAGLSLSNRAAVGPAGVIGQPADHRSVPAAPAPLARSSAAATGAPLLAGVPAQESVAPLSDANALPGSASVAPTTHSSTPVVIAVQHFGTSGPGIQDVSVNWASYIGNNGADRGNATALDAAGNVYVAGAFTDPADGITKAFVDQISPDGSAAGQVLIDFQGSDGSFYNTEANAIALDRNGTIYLAGQDSASLPDTGQTESFQMSLTTDFAGSVTVNWSRNFRGDATIPGYTSATGIAVSPDGTSVWATGTINTQSTAGLYPGQWIFLANLNGSDGTTIVSRVTKFGLGGNFDGDSKSYSIAFNSVDNLVYTGLSFVDALPAGSGNTYAAFIGWTPDLGTTAGFYLNIPGQAAALNAMVASDSISSVYYTGYSSDRSLSTQNLFYVQIDEGHTTVLGGFEYIASVQQSQDAVVGTGIALDTGNNPVVVGYGDDGMGTRQAYVARFDPTSGAFLDEFFYGAAGSTSQANGITNVGNTLYLAGTTNDPNFSLGPVFQPTYGGDPSDAFAMQVTLA
jgi:hypothetical protein